jgi:hypothetical protein
MLIALADENAGAEASLREQIDTVATAQKFLKEHPKAYKISALRDRRVGECHWQYWRATHWTPVGRCDM